MKHMSYTQTHNYEWKTLWQKQNNCVSEELYRTGHKTKMTSRNLSLSMYYI